MTLLLSLEYDLRPELVAYQHLLLRLFDAQADLRRTDFARTARQTRLFRGRADLWLNRTLDDLAFNFTDMTAGEHLAVLTLGQEAAAALLAQAQSAADPEAVYLAALTADLLAEAGRIMGIIASRLAGLGLLDGYLLGEAEGGQN
ncbi:MAG: hypothetical protein KJ077_50235 [Anaerolineae bacterium]|nr:hypothetical protein [Anaerolineae bacterium]